MSRREPLPIDPLLPEALDVLRARGLLVLEAPPGAGKTTRLPAALLDGLSGRGRILVLEPRRLAARLAAARVAAERGQRPGEEVGHQVRFETVAGPLTRLLFLTEGVFTRRLLEDPGLRGVDAVVVDEVHERHLHTDLALAMLRRLRAGPRPDLHVVVMSATLETAPVAAFLEDAPVLRSEGRRFPVEVEHLERADDRPLHDQVVTAVRRLVREGLSGHVLVFLPGAAEIRRAREVLEPLAAHAGLEVAALHGEMPAAEQDRALAPSPRPRVILSTNVAESSITVEGVVAVVDSGLARVARHSPWTGLPVLEVARVARSAAIQRAGRAGRTGPGRCLRLYTQHDFDARPPYETPEIRRADLAELVLTLAGLGVTDPAALPWLEAPPEAGLQAALELLRRLGALDPRGGLTARGRTLLSWPLHPRLSQLLVEGARRGVFDEAATAAALLGERDVLAGGPAARRPGAAASGPSDLEDRIERLREAQVARFDPGALRRLGLDPGAARAVDRARTQLLRRRPPGGAAPRPGTEPEVEAALREAVVAAFPDRVAQRRGAGRADLRLAGGGEVVLAQESVVRDAEYLVAVDVTERRQGGRTLPLVRLASALEPEWLLELFPEQVSEGLEAEWNAGAGRVDVFSRMRFGQVVLAESREPAGRHPGAAELLAEQALKAGVQAYVDPEALARLAGRLRLAHEVEPDGGFFEVDAEAVRAAVVELCRGRSNLAELERADLVEALLARLDHGARRRLDVLAPTHVDLPGRRRAPVHYPDSGPPYVASRIQDFFGLRDAPRIAGGRVPLQVRLLAPNQRPVQITQDLAGFWERHYPDIRRELSRRYPRHAWPERPA